MEQEGRAQPYFRGARPARPGCILLSPLRFNAGLTSNPAPVIHHYHTVGCMRCALARRAGVVSALLALARLSTSLSAAAAPPPMPAPPGPLPPPPARSVAQDGGGGDVLAPAPAPANSAATGRTVFVYGPRSLRAALDDQAITTILLRPRQGGPAIINASGGGGAPYDWGAAAGPATIAPGRNLTIAPVNVGGGASDGGGGAASAMVVVGTNATGAVLDLRAAPTPAVVIAAGGALRFERMTLLAAAPQDGRAAQNHANAGQEGEFPAGPAGGPPPFYATPQLGPWPSLAPEPDAELGFLNTTIYAVGGCGTISACLPTSGPGAGVPAPGTQAAIAVGDGAQLLVRAGFADCLMPVLAGRPGSGSGSGSGSSGGGSKVAGQAHIYYLDSVTVCTEKDGATAAARVQRSGGSGGNDGSSGGQSPCSFPWWAGLVVGVLAAILLAGRVTGAVVAQQARKRGRLPWGGTHHRHGRRRAAACFGCGGGRGRDAEAPPPPPLTPPPGEGSAPAGRLQPATPLGAVARMPPPPSPPPQPPPPAPPAPVPLPVGTTTTTTTTSVTAAPPPPMGTIARSLTAAEAVRLGELRSALASMGHPMMARSLSGGGGGGGPAGGGGGGGGAAAAAPSTSRGSPPAAVGDHRPSGDAAPPPPSTASPASDAPLTWATQTASMAAPLTSAWTALRVGAGEEPLEVRREREGEKGRGSLFSWLS